MTKKPVRSMGKKGGRDFFKPKSLNHGTLIKNTKPIKRKSSKYVANTNKIISDNIASTMKLYGPKKIAQAIDKQQHNVEDDRMTWRFYSHMAGLKNYFLPPIEFIGKLTPIFVKNNRKQDAKRLITILNNHWIPRLEFMLDYLLGFSDWPGEKELIVNLQGMIDALAATFKNEHRHLTGDEIPETSVTSLHNYFVKHYPKIGKELIRMKKEQAIWYGKSTINFKPF